MIRPLLGQNMQQNKFRLRAELVAGVTFSLLLAASLQAMVPNIFVKLEMKHPDHWKSFLATICRLLGAKLHVSVYSFECEANLSMTSCDWNETTRIYENFSEVRLLGLSRRLLRTPGLRLKVD